jgi:hypothetical protein
MASVRQTLVHAFHRVVAVVCAALVFALGLFSASPTLHKHLHDAGDTWDHDQCAIVQFATGVAVIVPLTLPPPTACEPHVSQPTHASEICLDSPRYLLRPERGPPVI